MITAIDLQTALVLIDLQKGIVGMPTAHPAADIIAKSADLLKACRAANFPVVVVNVYPLGAPWTLTRTQSPGLPKDPEAIKQAKAQMEQNGFFDIVPEIEVLENDIRITKSGWNAFYNTTLDETLKGLGVTGIILAGISTSIGVEGTARAASERGYNITFAEDAMTDLHADAHEHSLKNIFPRIGEIDSTENIIKKLNEIR